MATSSGTDSGDDEHPSWFTPKRLLVMFCIINMLNYVDRGVIASNGVNGSLQTCTQSGVCTGGSGIQGDFNLSYFEDGILSSAFMVGLLLACPIFASLAKSYNPFRLIGVGLSVWTFATAGCGASFDFWSIAIFRMLVGVGEASFISLAAPFIDDNAPKSQKLKTVISEIGSSKELHTVSRGDYPIYSFDVMKTAWLSLFYMCIPTGIAVGYVYGGVVGGNFNWRFAFFGEAILMLPFAVLGFVMQPLQMKGLASDESKTTLSSVEVVAPALEDGGAADLDHYSTKKSYSSRGSLDFLNQLSKFWIDMKLLLSEKVYVVNVLGYIAYNFVIGAYSYWGPKAGYEIYHMSNADLLFGGVTIVCGIFGTVAGGYILDYMGATISNAFKLLSGATFLGAIFCFSAFCSKNLYGFIFLFSIGELLVFATQGPVNWVCLHSVNSNLRPLSMAMSTVSIHIFGDVPSSPLVGVLQDYINNWRETSLILTTVFFVAAGIWFIGSFLHSVDKFVEDGEHETEPLLEGDTRGTVYGSDKSVTIPIS